MRMWSQLATVLVCSLESARRWLTSGETLREGAVLRLGAVRHAGHHSLPLEEGALGSNGGPGGALPASTAVGMAEDGQFTMMVKTQRLALETSFHKWQLFHEAQNVRYTDGETSSSRTWRFTVRRENLTAHVASSSNVNVSFTERPSRRGFEGVTLCGLVQPGNKNVCAFG